MRDGPRQMNARNQLQDTLQRLELNTGSTLSEIIPHVALCSDMFAIRHLRQPHLWHSGADALPHACEPQRAIHTSRNYQTECSWRVLV